MTYFYIILAFIVGVAVGDFTPQFLLGWYDKLMNKYKELSK